MRDDDRTLVKGANKVVQVCCVAAKSAGRFDPQLSVALPLGAKADGKGVVAPVSKVGHESLL